MRRKEFHITDPGLINPILENIQWGVLALSDENGYPYQVPLNPVWWNNSLYFHSALHGKKITLLKKNPRVHFSLVEPLSLIPSHFSSPDMACNATQFFLSVSMTGTAGIVNDLLKKAEVLTVMMQRLQPEGGYKPMDASDKNYEIELKKTALVEIIPESLNAKFKLGQNLSTDVRKKLVELLKKRGTRLDLLTAQWIENINDKITNV